MLLSRRIQLSHNQWTELYGQSIDAVGIDERAYFFTKRSIKNPIKTSALLKVMSMIDLTTLEGADTPERVHQLCGKARNPFPKKLSNLLATVTPAESPNTVAAVCVYPNMVPSAKFYLEGSSVQVASVATAFPAGQIPLDIKLADVSRAVEFGAQEIDMVINRCAFLTGQLQNVFDEIVAVKKECGQAHLKVILETGELGTYENIQRASELAILAGADFIKTSTGKVKPAATLPTTLIMLKEIAKHYKNTGLKVGMKPAGGIRTAKQALQYLCMVQEELGPDWLTPKLFRFGASQLLNDVLRQLYKQLSGHYQSFNEFSLD